MGLQFANGTTGLVAYNPTESCKQDPYSNRITGTGCLALLYDTSGYKTPNTSSKDLRSINVMKLGNTIDCIEDASGACWSQGFIPTPLSYTECLQLEDELGIQCYDFSESDAGDLGELNYWAGAAKGCHDQGGRLPTNNEVINLLKELYPSATLVSEYGAQFLECPENNPVCIDKEKAEYYGFAVTDLEVEGMQNNCIYSSELYTNADHADYIGLYSYIGIVNLGNGDLTYVPANYASGARCVFK